MRMFQCHISFQGCTKLPKQLENQQPGSQNGSFKVLQSTKRCIHQLHLFQGHMFLRAKFLEWKFFTQAGGNPVGKKWVFPKIGVPQNGWFMMENPIKIDDLGVPSFLEPPKSKGCGFLQEFPIIEWFHFFPWKSPSPLKKSTGMDFVGLKCRHDQSLQNKLLQNEWKHDEESGIDVLGQ